MSYTAIFAANNGGTPQQWATAISAIFTTPKAGKYRLTLVGVGSGASATQSGSSGAIAQSVVTLPAGVSITCTHGVVGTGSASAPVPGGTSTIAAPGITTLTCTGGTPAAPGVASGGTVFNRNGVVGSVGSSRGGSSVAVYGTGFTATGPGGAGTGTPGPIAGYPQIGGGALPGLSNVSSHLNGRLLQPAGIGGYANAATTAEAIGRPGGGGGNDFNGIGQRGGMFAGGGGGIPGAYSNNPGGQGGVGGGGGGSPAGSSSPGPGGEALSIIEWMED